VVEIFRNGCASAERPTRDLLEGGRPPTAILAMSDMLAMGALWAAQALGLQVPRELSIVGFDDIPLASAFAPALTTVRQPLFAKGELVAELLFEGAEPVLEVLGTELVVRSTTGPAPGR
jgi:DNA-binding LacI/PurR family transcriptional regulator